MSDPSGAGHLKKLPYVYLDIMDNFVLQLHVKTLGYEN